jgi:hypothetical protein
MTLLEDPAAAHQIRIRRRSGTLAVSCTCLSTWTGTWDLAWGGSARNPAWTGARVRGEAIETRSWMFPAADALAAWRGWHEEKGIEV